MIVLIAVFAVQRFRAVNNDPEREFRVPQTEAQIISKFETAVEGIDVLQQSHLKDLINGSGHHNRINVWPGYKNSPLIETQYIAASYRRIYADSFTPDQIKTIIDKLQVKGAKLDTPGGFIAEDGWPHDYLRDLAGETATDAANLYLLKKCTVYHLSVASKGRRDLPTGGRTMFEVTEARLSHDGGGSCRVL